MIGVGVVGAGFRAGLASAAEVRGTSRVVAVADTGAADGTRDGHPALRRATTCGTCRWGRLMREIVERGDIGTVQSVWVRHFVGNGGDFYFKDWHAERRSTTSLLLQKAAHDIDVVHCLAGAYTERVSAFGALRIYGDGHRRAPGTPKPADWLDPDRNWPPRAQRDLNPVIDVEDLSVTAGARTPRPVAARMSVAAGVQATESLRAAGEPRDIPPLDPQLVDHFERGQCRL